MLKRPTESYRKVASYQHKSSHFTPYSHHHGFPSLLDLPQESLTHITSYLPPPSLFALACTCQHLCQHVDNDSTWHRAFLNQFFGIGPENQLENESVLLLRRTENTWRKEFLLRHDIRRRWERSRNPTVIHSPQDSSIDEVHLMSENGLLTSSIQYGIVARSVPLIGEVRAGYITPSGTGLGIGNPNVEFAPDVSACAMSSHGCTTRVFWGKRDGEVALTLVNRAMDSRASSIFTRCGVNEQHEGSVQQLIPDSGSDTLLSAGADGRIKLWYTKTLQLLWSTDKQQVSLVTDPFITIAGGLGKGFVAGALKSGDIIVYDLHESGTPAEIPRVHSMQQFRISSLIRKEGPLSVADGSSQPLVAKMWLYRAGEMGVLLFVQYMHYPNFYRVHVDVQSWDVTITPFGESSFSGVTVLEPVVSTQSRDSMLFVGDLLGFVSIYDADAPLQASVAPAHRFEAHSDGAVTAIAWSPAAFATGSARGTTVVWDSLTLEPMRYFTTPAPRPAPGQDWDIVSRVLIDKDFVIIIVGNRVMSWMIGKANVRKPQPKKGKHSNSKMNMTTKGQQRYEMSKDIAESYMELEHERVHTQRVRGREREQASTLDTLGLSELEAVQYVLMLSRDEEEARRRTAVEEGVFEGDFDDPPNIPSSSRSMSSISTSISSNHPSRKNHSNDRQYPRIALPVSNDKVQVSPVPVPEPMEAGVSISPLRSLSTSSSSSPSPVATRTISSSSLGHFPAIISSSLSSGSSSGRGKSASPKESHSAWSTPLKSVSPSSPKSSLRSHVITPTRSSDTTAPSSVNGRRKRKESKSAVPDTMEMDYDLKLAIELSLAEARSKGKNM